MLRNFVVFFCFTLESSRVDGLDIIPLQNCSGSVVVNAKRSTDVSVGGVVLREIKTSVGSCVAECVRVPECRIVQGNDTICQMISQPVLSSAPSAQITFTVRDYCPSNFARICLPRVRFNFDDETVYENYGATFTDSKVGHGKAIAADEQYAFLGSYSTDSPILRPHLSPDGFTVAFWTQLNTAKDFGGVLSSRSYYTNPTSYGFGFMIYTAIVGNDDSLIYQLIQPSEIVSSTYTMNFPTDWIHVVVAYKAETRRYSIYHNGILQPDQAVPYTNHVLVNNPETKLVFGRMDVNFSHGYCNCSVDDVMIFEMELGQEDVEQLYIKN